MNKRKGLEDEERIKMRAELYARLKSQFPETMTDSAFGRLLGIGKQSVRNYKLGNTAVDVLYVAYKYPELDWQYVMTGRAGGGGMEVLREIARTRQEIARLANNVQTIEDKFINK